MAKKADPIDSRKQDRLKALGAEAGAIYHSLHEQVSDLHAKWYQYRVLYVEKGTLPVLNGTAPYLFDLLREVLGRDVTLHIAKLFDPAEQGDKKQYKNLTLLALLEAVSEPGLKDALASAIKEAKHAAAFAKRWRDKNLAHLERELAMGTSAHPLPKVSAAAIERALAGVSNAMNVVEHGLWQKHFDFTAVVIDDARSLLHFLRTGIEADRAKPSLHSD